MSELQSFFAPDDQSKTSTDLPGRVAHAAQNGELDTVQRWLAAGGSPDAAKWQDGRTITLLEVACGSSRPSNAEIVGLLCAAGVTGFILNIVIYFDIVVTVEPKRKALAEANAQLEAANTKLAEVNALVKD